MRAQLLLILKILVVFCFIQSRCQSVYNTGTSSYRNQTWMGGLDFGLPIRQISMLGTHNSVAFQFCLSTGGFQQTQSTPLNIQLESGIRALDIRVKHSSNQFKVYDRSCDLGVSFDTILTTVKTFLTIYPSETVLLHLVEEQSPSGSSRTFEDTYKFYRDKYPGLFWLPTTQDPQLGEVRGKIVLLQQFTAVEVHGLLWATFSVLNNKKMGTNWNLYDKWLDIKNFMPGVNAAKKSKIAFWTGHGGSYPYFVVSGKSSKNGGCLSTGLTTPGFKSSYPDFPRVACFIGICTICFEGMNKMGYNLIVNQGYTYTGIVYTDFYGDDLLTRIVSRNLGGLYPKCTTTQVAQGCTLCQAGTGACIKCNTLMHYVYDSINKKCLAQVGYYLDGSYIPQLCSAAETGCLQCTAANMCTKCDVLKHYKLSGGQCIAEPGYYLDASLVPVKCPQVGCAQCLDAVQCSVCSAPLNYIIDTSTGYTCKCDDINFFMPAGTVEACICMPTYFLSAAGNCEPMPECPDTSAGCLDCGDANSTICYSCDTLNHYVLDPDTENCKCDVAYFYDGNICSPCTTYDAACTYCANENLCLSCVANFTLTAGKCQCNPQYYLVDPDTCNLCETGCLQCTAIGACTICDATQNFVLVNGYCQCVPGRFFRNGACYLCNEIPGCVDCNNAGCTVCDTIFGFHLNTALGCQCDYGFFINDMKICEQCIADGCLNCLSQTQCIECDGVLGFYLKTDGICDDICGDGLRIYVDCDDGNTLDGDGCSSSCKVETDYTCTGGSRTTKDVCSYSGPFYLNVLSTFKDLKKNKVYISLSITPNIASLKNIDFSASINPSFSYESKTTTFDPNNSKIYFELTYNSSLNSLTSKDLQIFFDPPTSLPEYFYMKGSTTTLPQVTDNNLALKYYEDNIYNLLDIMKTLVQVTSFLYIGICLICFIFLSKLIAIELILVPQITFAGLIMLEKIQTLLQPLNGFKIVNGFNPLFTDSIELPTRLHLLFYQGNLLSNFNICLVIVLLPLIVGLVLLGVGKIMKSKNVTRYSYRAMKEWILSVLLVFQFQFTISFGIDFLYGNSPMGKVIGGLLVAGLLIMLVLFFKKPLNFGQFKNYFNRQPRFMNHYIAVVIWRIALALDLIMLSNNKACGFAAIGITAVYLILLIVMRPYLKNVRPIMNVVVVLAILAIESVYKMNFYSQDAQFMTSYLPLFVVVLLLVLLLANVIFMILEVKDRWKKNQIDKYQKNDDESFDEELKKELQRQMDVVNAIQMALQPTNISKLKQKEKNEEAPESQRKVKGISQLEQMRKDFSKSIIIPVTPNNMSQKQALIYEQI